MCGEQRARCTTRPCSPSTCPTTRRRRSALFCIIFMHSIHRPRALHSRVGVHRRQALPAARAPPRGALPVARAAPPLSHLLLCVRARDDLHSQSVSCITPRPSPHAHSFMVHADLRQQITDEGNTLDAVEAIVDELCARYQVSRRSHIAAPRSSSSILV